MNSDEYVEKVKQTESSDFEAIRLRLHDIRTLRLLHAGIGMVTEAAEFIDALKKCIFYGKNLDEVNLKEEIGDSNWYHAIAIDELGSSFEEIWDRNIEKLAKRYGIKFDEDKAISRDLEAERYILEKD